MPGAAQALARPGQWRRPPIRPRSYPRFAVCLWPVWAGQGCIKGSKRDV